MAAKLYYRSSPLFQSNLEFTGLFSSKYRSPLQNVYMCVKYLDQKYSGNINVRHLGSGVRDICMIRHNLGHAILFSYEIMINTSIRP